MYCTRTVYGFRGPYKTACLQRIRLRDCGVIQRKRRSAKALPSPAALVIKRGVKKAPKTRVVLKVREKWKLLKRMQRFFRQVKLPITGRAGYRAYMQGAFKKLPAAPKDFPHAPHSFFRELGWAGYGESLGLPELQRRTKGALLPFDQARRFARGLGLRSAVEWQKYRNGGIPGLPPRPSGIPSNPQESYADKGWRGYPDFLGYEPPFRSLVGEKMSFDAARRLVRGLHFKSGPEFRQWLRGLRVRKGLPHPPENLPLNPRVAYPERFKGMPDFIGAPDRRSSKKG